MTTEHEMLEFAAKAVGVDLINLDYEFGPYIKGTMIVWNPIKHSSACATMCAKLDINTLFAQTNPIVSCWKEGVGDTTTTHYNENHDGTDAGKEAAWRYAATIVAAKIGGMK